MWLFSQSHKKTELVLNRIIALTVFTLMLSGGADVNIRHLDSKIQNQLQMITVQDINSREGQLYVRELRNLFHIGGKTKEKYKVTTSISVSSSSTLSAAGASSTLKKMTMVASFALFDRKDGRNLLTGSVTGDATLGTVSSLFGQGKAETHARERLAILLAQRVVRRLQLYFLDPEIYLKPTEGLEIK